MSLQSVLHLNNPFLLKFTGGINPTGEYDNAKTYQLGDSVSYLGGSYVALMEVVGKIPTDSMYWQVLSIQAEAEKIWEDDGLDTIKPRLGKLVEYSKIKNTPTKLSDFDDDANHRLVSDILINNWNTAYDWGDHAGLYDPINSASSALLGHLTAFDHNLIATALQSETDPIFSDWLLNTPPLYSENDPVFSAWLLNTPPLYSETDPIFTAWDKSTGISITESQISDLKTYIQSLEKGANNGVATLDAGGKVPTNQLPSTLLIYKGVWNATTNTPTLLETDAIKKGFVYNVAVAGTQFDIDWKLGDWAIYNDSGVLEKSDNSDDVVSVNGQQGVVVLNKGDIGLGNVDNTSDLNKPISTATQNTLDLKWSLDGNTLGSKKTLGSIDNQDFGIITNNTERLTVLKGGNVGIGTTAPVSVLDIVSSGKFAVNSVSGAIKITPNPSLAANEYGSALILNARRSDDYDGAAIASVTDSTADWDSAGLAFLYHNSTNTSDRIEAMRITSTGNVGIGTTNPVAKLHINGGTGNLSTGLAFGDGDTGIHELADDILKFSADSNTSFFASKSSVQSGNTSGWNLSNTTPTATFPSVAPNRSNPTTGIGWAGADVLSLIAGGVNGLNINSSGRVGIGTTAPLATLHVNNSSGQASLIVESTGVTAGSRADMKFASQLGDVALRFNAESSSGNNYIQSGNYAFNGNKPLYFTGYSGNQGSTVNFNFATNLFTGNVGIGTTNPTAPLTIQQTNDLGGFKLIGNSDPTTIFSFYIGAGGSNNPRFNSTKSMVFEANNVIYLRGYSGGVFINNDNNQRVSIAAGGGNVGIGTTAPSTRLHVAGTTALHNIQTDTGLILNPVLRPTGFTAVLANDGAGNVNAGDHYYYVAYTTDLGDTELSRGEGGDTFGGSAGTKITTTAENGKVNISVTASTDYRVTGIKIYRTTAGSVFYGNVKLVATLTNTTQTYLDNIADASLTGDSYYVQENKTNRQIYIGAKKAMLLGMATTLVGYEAGSNITIGGSNTFLGAYSGNANTNGGSNTFVGYGAGRVSNTNESIALGKWSLYKTTGGSNIAIGNDTLFNNTTGAINTAIGNASLFNNTTGSNNSAIGMNAGRYLSDGTTGRETGSNGLYLGYSSKASANGTNNEIVIGFDAIGKGSNTAVIGNNNLTALYVSGQIVPAKLSSEPTGIEGGIYYNTTDKHFYGYNGTTYVQLDN